MDSFSNKPHIRAQLGRHLAETPYTVNVPGSHSTETSPIRTTRNETTPQDGNRSLVAESLEDGASQHHEQSNLKPTFDEEPVTINDNVEDDGGGDGGSGPESSSKPLKMNRRVLTQRYQLDQMRSIKRKIAAEDWILTQLQDLTTSDVRNI